jgi:pimeloyl-ACP methyl ester carboxylesterase
LAETLVMIHGMWGTPSHWENFRGYFGGRGYRCLTPTLRYHDMDPQGIPDPRLGRTSLLDYAGDLEKIIRGLEDRPVLLGFSMGGVLAQILASRGLAKAAVLLSPAPPAGINALRPSIVWEFRSALLRRGFWRKPFRLPYRETSSAMLSGMPAEARRGIYDGLVYESGRAACEIGFWFLDPKGALKVDASKVTCPMLIISGGKDREHPIAVIRKVAKRYARVATFDELPDHGHWLVAEPGWERIAARIDQWLLRTLGGPV